MCDNEIHQFNAPGVSRRVFTLSAAAIAVMGGTPAFAAEDIVSKDVTVKTPDGEADAVWFYPPKGRHPAVLIWTDVFGGAVDARQRARNGLRRAMRPLRRAAQASPVAVSAEKPKSPFDRPEERGASFAELKAHIRG